MMMSGIFFLSHAERMRLVDYCSFYLCWYRLILGSYARAIRGMGRDFTANLGYSIVRSRNIFMYGTATTLY